MRLLRHQHGIDHMDHAVRGVDIGHRDGCGVARRISQHDIVAVHHRGKLCTIDGGQRVTVFTRGLDRCGQRGCLEAYVADFALVREAPIALNGELPRRGEILESLFRQAKDGNEAARAIFDRAGRYLALGLANVANLFDPRRIILSGSRMRYDFLYAEEMLAEVASLTLNPPPPIEVHAWDDLVWARGAAALSRHAQQVRITIQV